MRRHLVGWWAVMLGMCGWLVLGGLVLTQAPGWFPAFARATWGLMVASAVALPFAVRRGNRRLAALQAEDARG